MLGLHFTPVCVLLSVRSLHFTLRLHFTPGPQSAVCSPQSAFYTDRSPPTLKVFVNVFAKFVSPSFVINGLTGCSESVIVEFCIFYLARLSKTSAVAKILTLSAG